MTLNIISFLKQVNISSLTLWYVDLPFLQGADRGTVTQSIVSLCFHVRIKRNVFGKEPACIFPEIRWCAFCKLCFLVVRRWTLITATNESPRSAPSSTRPPPPSSSSPVPPWHCFCFSSLFSILFFSAYFLWYQCRFLNFYSKLVSYIQCSTDFISISCAILRNAIFSWLTWWNTLKQYTCIIALIYLADYSHNIL